MLTMSRVIKCCAVTLFPPLDHVISCVPWPQVHTKDVRFDKLNKLVALLLQRDVVLTLAVETYDFAAARSSFEIQTLLRTVYLKHFTELVH